MNLVFFGSTSDSILVLEKLVACRLPASPAGGSLVAISVIAVVTQPPRPISRKQIVTPTPVETWAKEKNIPCFSFPNLSRGAGSDRPWLYADEQKVIDVLQSLKPDLLISASYGQRIPWETIKSAKYGGLNVHPSLLPRWRGADPIPWTILAGDQKTGVTIVTLSKEFDSGRIIAWKKIPVPGRVLSDSLRYELFRLGAHLLKDSLPRYVHDVSSYSTPGVYKSGHILYARRLTRDDGYVPWEILQKAIEPNGHITMQQCNHVTIVKELIAKMPREFGETPLSIFIDRLVRALSPWPGVWTIVRSKKLEVRSKGEMRVKILSAHPQPTHSSPPTGGSSEQATHNPQLIVDTVQLAGKKPIPFSQFQSAYLT